jgi:hypothetical protein
MLHHMTELLEIPMFIIVLINRKKDFINQSHGFSLIGCSHQITEISWSNFLLKTVVNLRLSLIHDVLLELLFCDQTISILIHLTE